MLPGGKLVAFAVSTSMILSSTAAVASAAAPQANPWAVLGLLSGGASAAAACGAAAATAAQPAPGCVLPQVDRVAPVAGPAPAPMPAPYVGIGTPPLPVLAILAAVLGTMIYILTKDHNRIRFPNSPA